MTQTSAALLTPDERELQGWTDSWLSELQFVAVDDADAVLAFRANKVDILMPGEKDGTWKVYKVLNPGDRQKVRALTERVRANLVNRSFA